MSFDVDSSVVSRGRILGVDVARGVAILGMFGYHLTWDLAHFGFISPERPFSSAFRFYSHIVASAFLFIAGTSLVLARREPFAWRLWTRHMLVIAGAAALVTAASFVFFPEGPITFGILHCIGAGLLFATPFLFLPSWASLFVACLIVVAPVLVQSSAFDNPWLVWTGLGTTVPRSNDFRPFFPWASPVLAGVATAAWLRRRGMLAGVGRRGATTFLGDALAFGGRHSLVVYLVHQPLFFGALAGLAAVVPASLRSDDFPASCERQCVASGARDDMCRNACGCMGRELRHRDLWDRYAARQLNDAQRQTVSEIAQACVREAL